MQVTLPDGSGARVGGINVGGPVLTYVMAQQTPTQDQVPADIRPWPALFALCLASS